MEVHTYAIPVPSIFNTIAWIIPISILFGLAAAFFFYPLLGGIIFKKLYLSSATSIVGLYLHLPYISQERQNI
jgi:hypothetical protein